MKPVIIIGIAVVCLVVVVLGVLVGLSGIEDTQYREYQQQIQIQQKSIELQNKEMCEELFPIRYNFDGETPYEDCLEYGHEVMMKLERDECRIDGFVTMGTNIQTQCELRMDLQYLNAIKRIIEISNEDRRMIETEIIQIRNELSKLDQEYDEFQIKWEKSMIENRNEFELAMEKLTKEEFKGIPLSEIKTGTPLTKKEIMDEYRTCILDNKSKSKCIELVEDLWDKRCRWITNSPSEYDSCFLDMSVFRE